MPSNGTGSNGRSALTLVDDFTDGSSALVREVVRDSVASVEWAEVAMARLEREIDHLWRESMEAHDPAMSQRLAEVSRALKRAALLLETTARSASNRQHCQPFSAFLRHSICSRMDPAHGALPTAPRYCQPPRWSAARADAHSRRGRSTTSGRGLGSCAAAPHLEGGHRPAGRPQRRRAALGILMRRPGWAIERGSGRDWRVRWRVPRPNTAGALARLSVTDFWSNTNGTSE